MQNADMPVRRLETQHQWFFPLKGCCHPAQIFSKFPLEMCKSSVRCKHPFFHQMMVGNTVLNRQPLLMKSFPFLFLTVALAANAAAPPDAHHEAYGPLYKTA